MISGTPYGVPRLPPSDLRGTEGDVPFRTFVAPCCNLSGQALFQGHSGAVQWLTMHHPRMDTHAHTHTRIRTNSHTHAAVTNSTLNWTWQPVKCEWSLEILTGKEYSPLIHEGQGFFLALYKKQASSYMYYITSAAAVAVNLYRFPMSNPYRCKRLGTGWSLHAGPLMSWWPMTAKTKKVQ